MFRISKMVDYGTVVMTYLAQQKGEPINARVIASETHLKSSIVTKILKLLTKAGLLLSERGIQGGYRLAKPAAEISIEQIIIALDNPISLTECCSTEKVCFLEHNCSTKNHWSIINEIIRDVLKKISLAEIVMPTASVEKIKSEKIKVVRENYERSFNR